MSHKQAGAGLVVQSPAHCRFSRDRRGWRVKILDCRRLDERKLLNAMQSLRRVAAMLALCAQLLFACDVWMFVFAGVALSLAITPKVAPQWVLR